MKNSVDLMYAGVGRRIKVLSELCEGEALRRFISAA